MWLVLGKRRGAEPLLVLRLRTPWHLHLLGGPWPLLWVGLRGLEQSCEAETGTWLCPAVAGTAGHSRRIRDGAVAPSAGKTTPSAAV